MTAKMSAVPGNGLDRVCPASSQALLHHPAEQKLLAEGSGHDRGQAEEPQVNGGELVNDVGEVHCFSPALWGEVLA